MSLRSRKSAGAHARIPGAWLAGWVVRLTTAGVLLMIAAPADAVPAFARQMGVGCTECHTAYPQLNAFGREFKLMGYTLGGAKIPWYQRFALMTTPSLTHTNADLEDPPEDFGPNDNFAFTQTSLFYGGRVAGKVGALLQATYDGVEKVFGWDTVDVRFADSIEIANKPLVYGIDVNNNPTVQDLWNTTPAWSFPFSSSGIAETPAAATLIQSLGQQVIGAGAYALWNELLYLEVSGYHRLDDGTLRALGVPPADVAAEIDGVAPYWRAALQREWGPHYLAGGTFGLVADTFPARNRSAGHDRFTDIGLDLQYQYSVPRGDLALRLSWIGEQQDLDASRRLGAASNGSNRLTAVNANVSYLYDQTWGATAGYAELRGDADSAYYGTEDGSPDSRWVTLQLDWLPFNKHGGPAQWPRLNPKLSLQYITYGRFDGTTRGASDNDTLYLQVWLLL